MILSGKAWWAKICGVPVPGYDKDSLEWSMELACLTQETIAKLKKTGIKDTYFKDKGDERGTFLRFVRKAVNKDGSPAKPIVIIDAHGNPWNQNTLIGNGSDVNVNVIVNPVEWKGSKFLKPSLISVQVWEHVPYKSQNGFPTKTKDLEDIAALPLEERVPKTEAVSSVKTPSNDKW